ncbi:PLP-dependent aminotransferase family protein [Roseibium aggregatum]|uniref:PLP-dependent aminotransferase family protein n=1 Tax=Roseibium aggregatum TaxID=187304 RepID=A0A926S7J8_9HYPH|nr:PLP-dependent aminotransferase family protein [Roseibium aggregatum]MBD1547597.1 PLP-dependent aminotransferase family protein [Roseibium aggregatum]
MQDWSHLFATRSSRMAASEIRELLKLLDRPEMISFAGGIPDPALFPADAFRDAYGELFGSDACRTALQYSVSEGYPPLRQWIADRMAELGIPCSIDNILITSGSQQALDYLGKLFLSPGDTALVGWPTYLGALQAFNAYEPSYDRLLPAANRSAQDYRDTAAENGGAVKFAYCSADFANPTGLTLDLSERERILDLATDLDVAVIEDAAYQSLRYDGEPLPPILALDIARNGGIDNTRTIYCGSFSKTLSPGLRVGWVCAAAPVIQKLVLIKQASDLNSSTINQVVMAGVAERAFDAQVTKIRKAYRARRDCMLDALERNMPDGVTWNRPEGGMFIWLELPASVNSADLLARSIEEAKVAFVPGGAFFPDGTGTNCMRLNFSAPSEEKIEEGIARLGRLISETLSR